MNILLIMKITSKKISIHVAEMHREGRLSQENVDIGLSFCIVLYYVGRLNFSKNYKKSHKLPVFCSYKN